MLELSAQPISPESTFLEATPQEGVPTAPPAGGPAEEAGGGLGSFLVPMLLIIGIFYVVLILPERKKQKARDAMLKEMQKGDRVMTSSGIYGSVAQVQDDVVTLQVADGVRMRFNRAAIQTVLTEDGEKDDKK
jgi:preprotein translocase subunit YajC